jgi:hypothetical protein
MTDIQLYLLLMSMLDDLRGTVSEVHQLMPEDAEREQTLSKVLKEEYRDDPRFQVLLSPDAYETVAVHGEYVALQPLMALQDKWGQRIKVLLGGA